MVLNFAEQTGSGAVTIVWSFLPQRKIVQYINPYYCTYIIQCSSVQYSSCQSNDCFCLWVLLYWLFVQYIFSFSTRNAMKSKKDDTCSRFEVGAAVSSSSSLTRLTKTCVHLPLSMVPWPFHSKLPKWNIVN